MQGVHRALAHVVGESRVRVHFPGAFGRFPQNRVVQFSSLGHYFFMTKPDQTERVIDDFLNHID